MTTPDFLVIGVPRAGTTWLHEAMLAHPQIGVPTRRKELHFFDRNYERGVAWYASYFAGLERFDRIGEVTPAYLYVPDLITRLRAVESMRQLIVVLRDPVERVVSHYRWRIRQDGYQGSFDEFLRDYPESLDWGDYEVHLERLSAWREQGRLLVLSHERLHDDESDELERLSSFLGVEVGPFRNFSGTRVNQSHEPRFPRLWSAGSRLARRLRDRRWDATVNWFRKAGLKRALQTGHAVEARVEEPQLEWVRAYYRSRLHGLDRLVGRDLTSSWPWMRVDSASDFDREIEF